LFVLVLNEGKEGASEVKTLRESTDFIESAKLEYSAGVSQALSSPFKG
jgi:hypothetical protein